MDTPVTIGPISLPPAVLAAIIAAIASIFGAVVSFVIAMWNTRKAAENSKDLANLAAEKNEKLAEHQHTLAKDLEKRKTELTIELDNHESELAKKLEAYRDTIAEKQEERKARRDYQYEARKRLYQEYEPLLFQLVELSESALSRIRNLAGSAKRGKLEPGQGWLSREGEYYLQTTMYRLISPLAIIRLMQRRLTLVDLTVDNVINHQYLLAKYLYQSFSDDFRISKIKPDCEYDPVLKYDPYARVDPNEYKSNPAKRWRQGISFDRIDTAAEALIIRQPEGSFNIMSAGQFSNEFLQDNSAVRRNFIPVYNLFLDFHPRTRPVLWRLLIAQAHIYTTLKNIRTLKLAQIGGSDISEEAIQNVKPWESILDADRTKYNWRQSPDEATEEKDLWQPFEVAQTYLKDFFVRYPLS